MENLDFSFSSIETHVSPKSREDPYIDPGSQAPKRFYFMFNSMLQNNADIDWWQNKKKDFHKRPQFIYGIFLSPFWAWFILLT